MRVVELFALLLTTVTRCYTIPTFPENYVGVRAKDSVKIHCNTSSPEPVTWKLNGHRREDFSDFLRPDGVDLLVTKVDQPLLGEYSCWRNHIKLSSTYLLLEDQLSGSDSHLSCRAKSYDCRFTCVLDQPPNSAVRLGLGSDCSRGSTSCQWVQSSRRTPEGKLHFDMVHTVSSSAEEADMLTLTFEAFEDLTVLRGTRRFYLRDIVRPDSPIVGCETEKEGLRVTIDPPSTWSRPLSFFSLEHEIEYVSRDDGQSVTTTSTLIPQGVSSLRVRSRDPLVMSRWSHWSGCKNIQRGNKNICRCKKKFFCPELTSESILRCQKRKHLKARRQRPLPRG